MTVNNRRILYLILGIISGLAAFAAVDLLTDSGLPNYLALALTQGAAIGFIFGFAFGFADGIIYHELKNGLIRALIAAAAGAVTAAAAQVIASQGMMLSANAAEIMLPLWRGAGWMLMGAAIGAIDGIQHMAVRRAAAGAIGGLTGGLIGGLIFEFLIRLYPDTALIKAAGLILMGALTGLFIGEFERRFSFARLRILNGPLKDREYLVVKKKTSVGSGIKHDIPVRGYENIPTGVLLRRGREVSFEIHGGPESEGLAAKAAAVKVSSDMTLLNDQPLNGRHDLKFQDVIKLGKLKLIYLSL